MDKLKKLNNHFKYLQNLKMNKIVLALVAVAAILGTGLYLYHAKKTTTLSTSNIPTPVYDLWVHWKNTHSK